MKSGNKEISETPLMKQYFAIKGKYPDALLLFRVGDFYETFGEDAIRASSVLGIVLTKRANGSGTYIELAGFPHHSLDTYLPKLVRAGMRVAICDQLEDPKLTKKIVKRGVTELVTPGVTYHDKVLEHKENNFLACLHLLPRNSGLSFLDVSTGEFLVAQGNDAYIEKLLQTFKPSEVILQKSKRQDFTERFGPKFYITTLEDWVFTLDFGKDLLVKHFGTSSLKGFGVDEMDSGIIAAGASMHYLSETRHDRVQHISRIARIEEDHYVWLDRFTIRNLELLHSPFENAKTLLDVMDATITPMGSRLLRRYLILPLKESGPIRERQEIVSHFIEQEVLRNDLSAHLKSIGDLERLISKVAIGRVNPREMQYILRALESISPIRDACLENGPESLRIIADQLNPCSLIADRIRREIKEDPPVLLSKGGVIAEGVSVELDELRSMAYSGKDYLQQILQREIANTGITSLKIAYNNVFGYYLEVTNTHKDKVPPEWHRKQTLVNCERYITEELKDYEERILGAEEKILALESAMFSDLVLALSEYTDAIQQNAIQIARIDVLISMARIALQYNYVKPEIEDTTEIRIEGGRHPVIEQQLPPDEPYVANDLDLDSQSQQILIITGPNMSGKSAFLRQTALIVLMAQMGSYVPATAARIGIVDKIFTRVGAADNISSGESTFMVEMNETASILNNLSDRSLILLDEIGRGTSTYDGISIAWAIAEYLHEHPLFHPKVLFATHYHELNEMAQNLKRIRNFHVTVREIGNKVLFLRKLSPGGTEHSFGIHVARMAGIPQTVLRRSEEILEQLEKTRSDNELSQKPLPKARKTSKEDYQLSFIQLNDPLLEQIKEDILNTDINNLTPVEALMKLNAIKKLLGA